MAPTNEYTMRHSANLLANFARAEQSGLAESDVQVINFAYQQLHRGANMVGADLKAAPVITGAAQRAAEAAYTEKLVELRLAEGGGFKAASQQRRAIASALEAALPHLTT